MKQLSLLIKPASGLCNMRCKYCFYKEELSHSQCIDMGIMSEKTMTDLVERICQEVEKRLQITFQGGEPTLAGLDYFRKFTELFEKKKSSELEISWSFQTNGILIDEKWAEFFREKHFLVGLSFDGMPQLHDRYRLDIRENGTSERVLRTWELLQRYKVETNLLCVVTKQVARKPERVYHYMKEMGAHFLQFIPCIQPLGRREGTYSTLLTEDYVYFLSGLFDCWYQDWKRGQYVSIRQFDDYVHLLCGQRTSSCAACGRCGGYLAVENDGSLYPCDFYINDKWYLGNICKEELKDIFAGQKMRKFLTESHIPEKCRQCRYYDLCCGGCKNDRKEVNGQYENIFCEAYKKFFNYAEDRLRKIADVEYYSIFSKLQT